MTDIDTIRARLAACPIPEDARADWDGSNHYEVQTPTGDEWCWLEAGDALGAANASNTEPGKRLGAVLDYACHYKRDVAALLAALDGKAQKEGGDTCSDCPPAGYPTDKTRCDECPRRAQGEADRG